jgi:O-antigen ligase
VGAPVSDAVSVGRVRVLSRSSLTPLVCFLSPFVTAAVPRLTWLFLPLLALAFVLPVVRRGGDWRQLLRPNAALWAMVLVAAYALLSAIWAADPGAAIGKGLLLLAMTLVTFVGVAALAEGDAEQLRRAAFAFAAGAFLGGLFMLFELLTNAALSRAVVSSVGWLKPAAMKLMIFVNGRATGVDLSQLNRNVAIVMFNLWAGLLALQMIEERTRRSVAMLLLFLATAVPVFLSNHQSSQVALLLSLLAFFFARRWPRPAFRALAALWCLGFVLVLPADFLAYKAGLHLEPWMPSSFKARVIIWEYTAERVLDHPWLGIGARSTRDVRQPKDLSDKPAGFVYPRNTGRHAHDMFLQSWYELGLVGVILIAIAGAIVAIRMSLLPLEVQPFAAATFATFLGIAAFAWGMWQTWLICAVGLLALYLRLAGEARRSEVGASQRSGHANLPG